MITKKEINKMSVPDRLKAIEMIWESISTSSKYVQSPAWHQEILKTREDKVKSGNATFSTIDEVRERLKRKADKNFP